MGSFQRSRQALASQKQSSQAFVRRPEIPQADPSHPQTSSYSTPRPPRASTYDLPGPPQNTNNSNPFAVSLAASILGPRISALPVVQGLKHHPMALHRRFWQAVQGIVNQVPETNTNGMLLRRKLEDRLPDLFLASYTTMQPPFDPTTSSQHRQPLKPASAAAVFGHDSALDPSLVTALNTTSRPPSAIPDREPPHYNLQLHNPLSHACPHYQPASIDSSPKLHSAANSPPSPRSQHF